jgi:hypothetical protein
MLKIITVISILILLRFVMFAQIDTKTICHIDNGRIVFKLDKNWNSEQFTEVSRLFDLDSALLSEAFKVNKEFVYDSVVWNIKQLTSSIIELSKDIKKSSESSITRDDLKNIESIFIEHFRPEQEVPTFGVNSFKSDNAFKYSNGIAIFYISQFKKNNKVILSGSFNNWNTTQNQMTRTDSGWMISIPLKPGKYLYKLIVDGKWQLDQGNRLKEKDENGIVNSVVYCSNYVFNLIGYKNSGKVMLAGSFNDWNPSNLKMTKTGEGWEIPVFINEGTHFYKFVVDGQWIADPANKSWRYDADGNQNSILEIGESHIFYLNGFRDAKSVILTGTFNNWSENELLMNKTDSGWELKYVLSDKMHEYKFKVDGNWIYDPVNPFKSGSGDYVNSVLVLNPNYLFILDKYLDAKNVCIAGNFNNWDPNGYHMIKKNGYWIFPVQLKPGKYLYKFVVDGNWITDPENKFWEENEQGTDNSVLWIKE